MKMAIRLVTAGAALALVGSGISVLSPHMIVPAAHADAGGNGGGNGNGNGTGNGNGAGGNGGGNGAAASAAASANSQGNNGHGAATSAAAQDKSTSGLAHAIGVVSTTPASPNALSSLQSALDAFTGRKDDEAGTPEAE
jgi:hypothetical protein